MIASNTLANRSNTTGRSYSYVQCFDPSELQDGVLTVTEDTGKRIKRTVSRGYLVSEQRPEGPFRVFLLVKDSDAGRADLAAGRAGAARVGDVYECRVASNVTKCNCFAGATGKVCLHAEAMADLVANGSIPDPRESGSDR